MARLEVLLTLSLVVLASGQKKRKPIVTSLNAKWANTPLLLEASEFLDTESPDYFWSFVSALSEAGPLLGRTDQEQYTALLEVAAKSLSPAQLDILKFSLSLRTESPKVEMHSHLARDRGVPSLSCSPVYDHGQQLSCQLPALKATDKKAVTYDIDHIYPGAFTEETPEVILYGEIGSSGLASAHKQLSELAREGGVKYILRHFVDRELDSLVRLSGYGVELQIKSTEYKAQDDAELRGEGGEGEEDEEEAEVEGFVFSTLKALHEDKVDKLAEMKQHLLDMNNDMAPMKVWQLQDLSTQAAQRIMASPAEDRLKVMGDLASNFPSHARSLSRITVPKELKKEVKKNSDIFYSSLNVQPNDAALFINGQHFDMEFTDIFTILDSVRTEERVLGGLGALGLDSKQTQALMSLDLGSKQQTYGVDVRDSAVHWINDIESDKLYKGWPEGVQELLRPTFPGMLRSIKKNFFNIVVMCDPSLADTKAILKLVESFYVHRAPTRIGIVFSVTTDLDQTGETDAGVALASAFNYISSTKEPYDALAFITDVYSRGEDTEDVTVAEVRETFLDSYGSDVKLDDVFGEDSEWDVGRTLAEDFVSRSGLGSLPQVLMNGVPFNKKHLNAEDFEEQLLTTIMAETQVLQRAVYKNQLTDSMDLLDYLMSRENIMPRLNQRILSSHTASQISLLGSQEAGLDLASFTALDKRSQAATLAKHLPYLTGLSKQSSKLRMVTLWVVADLESPEGRAVARAAVSHVKASSQVRVALVYNNPRPGLVSRTVSAALTSLPPAPALALLAKLLKEDTVTKLVSGKKQLADYDIPGVEMAELSAAIKEVEDDVFSLHALFATNVLGFSPGQMGVVTNGRVLGPLAPGEDLTVNDFDLLEKLTMSQYGEKLVTAFHSHMDVLAPAVSDQAMLVAGLLTSRPASKARQEISFFKDQQSVIHMEPRHSDRPAFDVVAIVDPVSRGAQKISPVLVVLQQVLNIRLRVFLNCVDKHSEMPNKSFFKQVLEPGLTFEEDGSLAGGPKAVFTNVPEQPILTLNMHTPDNWLVTPVRSVYDLDNIKLEGIEGAVTSEWELGSLLLEGHCFEAGTGNPPRGLQLTLGTKNAPDFTDTIVMANLGYLQLKAAPGAWFLNLRSGRSSLIYDIVGQENTDSREGAKDVTVLMNSFQSRIVKLKVAKKPDQKNEDLLPTEGGEEATNGWFSSIKNAVSGGGEGAGGEVEDEGLNIFCVATGHLYERLLKIMMLSVMKTTKTPVKFWILKNFLSPSLKEFIPEYAKRYGFQYEYVHYKWPRWLNQQKERQRMIWGYKILFLDVLFPLNLKKIIFVDTDQIVRTDLTELRDFDLGGAPYGYTPFCDSNTDMEGFRFWKQGYWRNHLAGRKYHISAIYVVDLVKFRQIAAGDRLRGQYQALSQDPNSLSNLDQDLPNNMIHQVPIKSLPQEWLWCETWCSKDSLKDAKSIDLCNNPLTKEPKLSAARRIVKEWTPYDEEMQRLGEEIASMRLTENSSKPKDEL